jgi:hypothetical protein
MKTALMYGASDMYVTLRDNTYALTTDKEEASDFGKPANGLYNTICAVDETLSRKLTGYKCGLLKVMEIN